ncbi:MAG: methyltransferase domain-containing protein, partial [bacterium]
FITQFSSAQSWRDRRDQPEKLMDIAGVKPGMSIGEAGAGRGYLTFHLSRRVGEKGRIYANDIDAKVLKTISDRCKKEGIKNIEIVPGKIADPCFPESDLDMIVMIYAFHDFTQKEAWLNNVKKYLKKDAEIVIFDREDSHTKMSEKLMVNLGEKTGFKLIRYDQLHNDIFVYILEMEKA